MSAPNGTLENKAQSNPVAVKQGGSEPNRINLKDLQLTHGLLAYYWLSLGLCVGYLIFTPFVKLSGNNGDPKVRLCMAVFVTLLFITALAMRIAHRLTYQRETLFIIIAGFVMRFGYMLYTPFLERGHDVGTRNGAGHYAYIYTLYQHFTLPATNKGQFYHPPLEHILCAMVNHAYALLTKGQNIEVIFEAARLVPCFASCALLIVCCRLFDELRFDRTAKLTALVILAFHPTFYLLSSSINNDMLMNFFFMTAFLYTVRWYRQPTFKNSFLLALCIGCAMMTKLSGGLAAVFTGFIFLAALLRNLKTGYPRRLIAQFALFASVCLPLGFWYPVRNYLLFGQTLSFVMPVSKNKPIYIGRRTIAERFFTFPLQDFFKHIYCKVSGDYQIWIYAVKSSVFGEFTFSPAHNVPAVFLLTAAIALVILSLAAMIYALLCLRRQNGMAVLGFFTTWLVLMVSYIGFNLKYPYSCTMDFRYIVPTVIAGAAFLGLLNSGLTKKGNPFCKASLLLNTTLIAVFVSASVMFYIF